MAKKARKRSKPGISKCPEPLQRLLDHINLLPRSEAELTAFSDYLIDLLSEAKNHVLRRPENIEEVADWYERQAELSPAPALIAALHSNVRHVKLLGKEFFFAQDVVGGLDGWIRDREMLTRIIEAYANHRELHSFFAKDFKATKARTMGSLLRAADALTATDSVSFGFNADSTLKPDGFRLLEILVEFRVEVRRLGICPICSRYYYAKKFPHETCGQATCAVRQTRATKKTEKK